MMLKCHLEMKSIPFLLILSWHLEMMMWYKRYQFLSAVRSQHIDLPSWRNLFQERKSAAITRAWPEPANYSTGATTQVPDEEWRSILDNFVPTFGITRHSLLGCFFFYLLDDHSDRALQNFDEEKHLHECPLHHVIDHPSTSIGSLLVVYYLQRHRYIDEYHVEHKLRIVEQEFLSKKNIK